MTTPDSGLVTPTSIFIDSTTHTSCPDRTVSPTFTLNSNTVPAISHRTGFILTARMYNPLASTQPSDLVRSHWHQTRCDNGPQHQTEGCPRRQRRPPHQTELRSGFEMCY